MVRSTATQEPTARTATGADDQVELTGSGRLSLLHVVVPAPMGGLESVVLTLARAQQQAGHSVAVAAIVGHADHPFVHAVRSCGVEVHVIPVGGRAYIEEYRRTSRLCRSLAPDIVHTHGYRADVIDARAARALGIRTVSTVHGFAGNGWKNRVYEWLQRRDHRRFDAVIAVSRHQTPELVEAGVARERVACVPNAFSGEDGQLDRSEARRILGLAPDAFVIGWVGRISEEKGPDILLDALQLGRLEQNLIVSIVGTGRQAEALRLRSEQSGLAPQLRWHGAVPGAGRLFRAFDLFVLSSRTEGTPIVLFEAMAAGVPIVATRVGGVPDVVTEREAFLTDAAPASLARAIQRATADPAGAGARTVAALDRLVTTYDVATWIRRHDAVYHAALQRPRSRS